MARVPEAEIGRLKEQVPLVWLAEAAGVVLARAGADLAGRCPFHEDGTPSLVISPGKNLWLCLGACQAGGSVIDWVMRAQGVSFRHAVELLRDGPAAVSAAGAGPKRSAVRKLAPPVERTAADHELLGQVTGYCHRVLGESPDVLGYLARRRIGHPEAIETFRLGFAGRTLGLRLPGKRRKEGAELRGRLEALGIFRASGHERRIWPRRASSAGDPEHFRPASGIAAAAWAPVEMSGAQAAASGPDSAPAPARRSSRDRRAPRSAPLPPRACAGHRAWSASARPA